MVIPYPCLEYAQVVVAGVIFRGNFAWYMTKREYWFLDYTKFEEFDPREDNTIRFHTPILNEKTAEHFLSFIAGQKVLASAFSQMMREMKEIDEDNELLDFLPCFLVDFDQRRFSSLFPEPNIFEKLVPDGWTGAYRDFLCEVPPEERYWIIDGHNWFPSEEEDLAEN